MKTSTFALLSLLFVLGCSGSKSPSQPSDELPPEGPLEIIKIEKDLTDYGSPRIWITVQNTSQDTLYNAACTVYAKDSHKVVLDDGFAYFVEGGNIAPGETAREDAIFFDLSSHDDYAMLTYELSWLKRD